MYLLGLIPRAFFHVFEKSGPSAILMILFSLVSFIAVCYLMARVARRSLDAEVHPISTGERRIMVTLSVATIVVLALPIFDVDWSFQDVAWLFVMCMIFGFAGKIRKVSPQKSPP